MMGAFDLAAVGIAAGLAVLYMGLRLGKTLGSRKAASAGKGGAKAGRGSGGCGSCPLSKGGGACPGCGQ
jgi:hypothetical protein